MLLDYACGGELFTLLRREGRFANDVALFFASEILLAFDYLHGMDIAYRDLKPENLIFESKGDNSDIKIADFGLAAKLKYPDEKLKLRCGSPGYVAPELLRNEGYNCSADVFSAGVIFYVMLTGRPLFPGSTPEIVLAKNKKCEYKFASCFWTQISPEARDLVFKMTTEDPAHRISA